MRERKTVGMRRARDILQSPSGPDRGESHEIRTQRICYRYIVKSEFVQMGFHFHGNILSCTMCSPSRNLVPQMGYALRLRSQNTSRLSNDPIAVRGRTSRWGKCSSPTSVLTSSLPLVSTSPHKACSVAAQAPWPMRCWAYSLIGMNLRPTTSLTIPVLNQYFDAITRTRMPPSMNTPIKIQDLKMILRRVLLRSDYITYADTSDCLVSFFFNPAHRSPCTIRSEGLFLVRYDLQASFLSVCTISISEPRILRYLVLGEFRSLSA